MPFSLTEIELKQALEMNLAFCPSCRYPATRNDLCPKCGTPCTAQAETYVEKLLETVLSEETNRAGMAVDVLTKWLYEPRTIVPLTMLLGRKDDPYPLVLAARGLGRLGDPQAVPALAELLLDENKPFVGRIAAAEALGSLGGGSARSALEQATTSPRPSVVKAATRALVQLRRVEEEIQ